MRASIAWSRPSCSVRFPEQTPRRASARGCCAIPAGCSSWSTWSRPTAAGASRSRSSTSRRGPCCAAARSCATRRLPYGMPASTSKRSTMSTFRRYHSPIATWRVALPASAPALGLGLDSSHHVGQRCAKEQVMNKAPIVIDLGKVSKKQIRALKDGTGDLVDEVADVMTRVREELGDDAKGKELVPVVLVYKRKPRKRRKG